jgi:GNAT superfamily N-acetyltransferase
MTGVVVRVSGQQDVAACVALIEERRQRYQSYEPRFWKKASNSGELSADWYARLIADEKTNVALLAELGDSVVGFLIASPIAAPPVYDSGGPTAMIDDFAVLSDQWEEVGAVLLERARDLLRDRGFVQIVVLGAYQDIPKSAFLSGTGLSLASMWWTGAL